MKKILLTITLLANALLNQAQVVTTFAGSGATGSTDATGIAASFNLPYGVCTDASGNVYVADGGNNKIRKITPAGVVSTFAGSGTAGSTDATGIAASFNSPRGVCTDATGNVYVADELNHKIRKITPAGVVSTFAGSGTAGSADATGIAASFYYPCGVCTDATGNVYVADYSNHKIRKITPAGVVSTFAGSGTAGSTDATGIAASFYAPIGVCTDAAGNVYVADANNSKIRKITPAGVVSTFAGSGANGSTDATGIAASFNFPYGVCTDATGNVYVADYSNHKIRKITPAGLVSTFAGSGVVGSTDATGIAASFNLPYGVCTDASGNVYVAEEGNHKIRKIDILSTTITEKGVMNSVMHVYPNPSTSALTIQTNEIIESVSIYNSLGSLIQTESKTSFSVEKLSVGIYTLQIKTIKGIGVVRFIKE